jgi:perosamine synthetase
MIPVARPVFGEEEVDAVSAVIRSGMIASGEIVTRFEEEYAAYAGVPHAIATSNGTTALHAGLLAIGIVPGDEVIVPSFTFIATATSVSMCGAHPVVADVDLSTWCIDPASVVEQITPKTRAIIGVHLFGQPCDISAMQEICEDKNLIFIEDCAQAHGATYKGTQVGNFGTIGCFSFYPTKNMTTGEGGLVTCGDAVIAEKVRRLINHGQKEKYLHTGIGYNYRLTNMGAAMGRVQLKKLDDMNRRRQENAAYYSSHITRPGIVCPQTRDSCTHVFHQYAIRVTSDSNMTRDQCAEDLRSKGVGTAIHYPIPVHEQPVYKGKISGSPCPVSRQLAGEILSLPVYPSLTVEEREKVCKAMNGSA